MDRVVEKAIDQRETVMSAVLQEMAARLESGEVGAGLQLLNLAETYAWLHSPDQPHGGRPTRPAGARDGGPA